MADRYVFADEAGNFDFSVKAGASRYFILTTVTVDDPGIGNDILALRRDMAWRGVLADRCIHATYDNYAVKTEVFNLLASASLRVDATILEKRKAQPHITANEAWFYQMAWYLHFKFVAPRIAGAGDRLLVTAASLGTKKRTGIFYNAVGRVVAQVSPTVAYEVAAWSAESDPCLQIADYFTWAIQRKWEGGDPSWHALVASKIQTEFDVWGIGTTYYY
jgi:Protein of unknown function (DUF3800)